MLSFLTGADIYLPSDPNGAGTIEVKETMRDPGGHQVTTNVPNWRSDEHTISVYFKDYEARSFP